MTKELGPEDALTRLTSQPKSHRIVVYDLESKDGPSQRPGFTRVFLGGVFDGTKFTSFRNRNGGAEMHWAERATADEGALDLMMRELLSRKYRGCSIYAHNGGSFDHLHILPWLTRNLTTYRYQIIPVGSSIQVLKVTHRKSLHSWTFLDSLRLLPMSLDQAAKTFGFEGKMSHSLAKHEDHPDWETYLERDCRALFEAVTQFQHLIEQKLRGELGVTAPSSAMKLFRRNYMGRGVSPAIVPKYEHFTGCATPGCLGCLHAWIRRGYCGGRVEVFRKKGKGLSYYDINSSYPRAMQEDMPAGEKLELGPCSLRFLERMHKKHIGFVECEVEIPETCEVPPLPYPDPKSGKLLFPAGRFHSVWSYDELKLLEEKSVQGSITRVIRSVWFERKAMFIDFVKELYAFRDKRNAEYEPGLALVSKLMMNSLYGKFGMNEERETIEVLGPGEELPEGAKLPAFEDGEEDALVRVYYIEKRVTAPYIIPQISAQITTLARIRLWRFLDQARALGGKLYYCDTDSLITDLDSLPTSSDLGELKNEYPGEKLSVELIGPKMYILSKRKPFEKEHKPTCRSVKNGKCKGCLNTKLAMKGFPKNLRTKETLKALQKGKEVKFKRLEKLGGMADLGFRSTPKMVRVSKRLLGGTTKRRELPDGSTLPRVIYDPYEKESSHDGE
jgi:hypothetical protein